MDQICFTCLATNPVGNAFFDYSQETFATLGPIMVWFFAVGFLFVLIWLAIKLAVFGIIDTPDSDPFVIFLKFGKEAFWFAAMGSLLIAGNTGHISLSGLWLGLSEVSLGWGMDTIKVLNPDVEPPKTASNIIAQTVGIFETGVYSFIIDGFKMIGDNSGFAIFQIGNTVMRVVFGLIMGLLGLGVAVFFTYIVLMQSLMAGFVLGFAPFLIVCGAFPWTRSIFWAGIRVLGHSAMSLATAAFIGGFVAWILRTLQEAAECVNAAQEDAISACEQQLSTYSDVFLGVGQVGGVFNDLARHWNNIEFYLSSIFLIVIGWLMLWVSGKFVSMIFQFDNTMFGPMKSMAGAAAGVVAGAVGGVGAMAMNAGRGSGGGSDEGSDTSGSDTSNEGYDSDGYAASDGESTDSKGS